MYSLDNYKFSSLILLCGSVILFGSMRYFNEKETFNKINKNYKWLESNDKKILDELKVYPDCLSRSFSITKKKKILLLIGGFRDTPNIWDKFEFYLKNNNIDYVIPRITGFGRSYFQFKIEWRDWVLSIMDQISILQHLYHQIDILGFSTGCNIALYVSQFNWKCKINNIILSSPNLIANNGDKLFKNILTSSFGLSLCNLLYPICHRPYVSRVKKNSKNNMKSNLKSKVFYEKNFPVYSAGEMWKFQDVKPDKIICENIIVIKPNNDRVIGDIDLQRKLILSEYNKNTELINIPSFSSNDIKVGHNVFNSSSIIIDDVFKQIKDYII